MHPDAFDEGSGDEVEVDTDIISGPFASTRIFLTSKGIGGSIKWTDTDVCGFLQLIRVTYSDIPDHPVYQLQVLG